MADRKIRTVMPICGNYGWGVCGRYLVRELNKLCNVQLMTGEFDPADVGDEDSYKELKSLCVGDLGQSGPGDGAPVAVLQAIRGPDLKPWHVRAQGDMNIGYTFFEKNNLSHEDVDWAKENYEIIVAGSAWCENVLKDHGLTHTETIIQGVDHTLFSDSGNEKEEYRDRFVVFSGGKLELRKGQDLVLAAIKILQQKYRDILLINMWYNPWSGSLDTMATSPYIYFKMPKGDYFKAVNHLLTANGIDPERVTTLPPMPHKELSQVYANTDIGLFPNRCEGGTNLVLMEYMACGKPVIASYSSGHRDILTERNSVCLKNLHPVTMKSHLGNVLYEWDEPSLDELVASLEWAYWHREEIKAVGKVAGEDMRQHTWKEAARRFYELTE